MNDLTFIPAISDETRASILTELKQIEVDNEVTILFAVESGSRAWGFPSPDSDYDVRFVYVHKLDWYLSLEPGRDVIERPISDDLDIGGWDLRKALSLLIKPNPVMFEWLSSPIHYLWKERQCNQLVAFSREPVHNSACLYHYLNLGRRQYELHIADNPTIRLKKYFYVLRPALAIRWMRLRPDEVPPMNIQALINGLDLPISTVKEIEGLIERKANLDEGKNTAPIAEIDDLIQNEFNWAQKADKKKPQQNLRIQADNLFREIVKTHDPDYAA